MRHKHAEKKLQLLGNVPFFVDPTKSTANPEAPRPLIPQLCRTSSDRHARQRTTTHTPPPMRSEKHGVLLRDACAAQRAHAENLRALRARGHMHARESDLRASADNKSRRGGWVIVAIIPYQVERCRAVYDVSHSKAGRSSFV